MTALWLAAVFMALAVGFLIGRQEGRDDARRSQGRGGRMTRLVMTTWLIAVPVSAQTLADNAEGRVDVAGNALKVESKANDPAEVRVGAPSSQNSVGKHSFDSLIGSSRDELVLWQGKQTLYGNRPGGVLWGGIKKPNFGVGDDVAMFNWFEVSYNEGVRFHLPVYAPNLTGGGGVSDHLQAGAYGLYIQTDGNFVIYERIGETQCPRWAITWLGSYYRNGSGYIDPAVLEAPCR